MFTGEVVRTSADTTSRQLNFDEMYLVWYPGYILRGEAQLAVQLVLDSTEFNTQFDFEPSIL